MIDSNGKFKRIDASDRGTTAEEVISQRRVLEEDISSNPVQRAAQLDENPGLCCVFTATSDP